MEAIICDECDKRVDTLGPERHRAFNFYEVKMRGPSSKYFGETVTPLDEGPRHFCCVRHMIDWLDKGYPKESK